MVKPKTKSKKVQHLHTSGKLGIDKRAEKLATETGTDDDELLNTTALAEWLGVSTQWVEIARSRGAYGPPFQIVGKHMIRYRRADVKAWLKEREYKSTAEYPDSKDGRVKRRERAEA